ncbi:hypothetical protein PISMIDRAFT_688962, partial [Pisolithus microcarpus 441]
MAPTFTHSQPRNAVVPAITPVIVSIFRHQFPKTMVMMTSQCWRIIMSATSAPGAKQAHGVGT